MDHKFVEYFEEELGHVRQMAEEFKLVHPKVAERLQLRQDPPDPYIQQLMDGFAFLAARVQLKLDAEFPRLIEALLQTVYPHYLAPLPSMAIVAFEPQKNNELAAGPVVRRGTCLTTKLPPKKDQDSKEQDSVRCKYVTAHDLQILPVQLAEARYFGRDLSDLDSGNSWTARTGTKAAICLRLEATAGLAFNQIKAGKLVIHLPPRENLTAILYEHLLVRTGAVVVQSAAAIRPVKTFSVICPPKIRGMGFTDDEALLPVGPRGFSGYRILQEYFAFPNRFFFLEIGGLEEAFRQCAGNAIDLIFGLTSEDERLEQRLQTDCFALHCVPAINLFPMENIVVDVSPQREEHVVVPDHNKTLEYEVYSVERVLGRPQGSNKPDAKFEFYPFHFAPKMEAAPAGFFTARRLPRKLTDRECAEGPVSEYQGSEVYLSLTGKAVMSNLQQLQALSVEALCTNRHLPLRHPGFQFDPTVGAAVATVKTITMTPPRPPHVGGELAWRVVSHLALNYRPLLVEDGRAGAAALQELLGLYVPDDGSVSAAQIRALKKAAAESAFGRVETPGPIAYARGLKISLEIDDTPFKDTGVFLMGAVLDRFFSRFVSLNSFVQTELSTTQGRKVYTWPISKGIREIL